ncbi:hypothetical protein PHISP_05945 [Aspergillus sp. HF37]|nr:hypothetical protein PHISP_05945 [Aspergillus sp. HF37]
MEEDYDTFQSSSARDGLTPIGKFSRSCSPSPEPFESSQPLGSGDSPSYEHAEFTQSGPNGNPGDWEESGLIEDSMSPVKSFSPISIGSPPPSSFGNLLSSDIDIPVATVAATQDQISGGHPNDGNCEAGSSGSEYSASPTVASQPSTNSTQFSVPSILSEQAYVSPPTTPSAPGSPVNQAQNAYPTPPPTPGANTQLFNGYVPYASDDQPDSDGPTHTSLLVGALSCQLELFYIHARSQTPAPRGRTIHYEVPAMRTQSEPPSYKRNFIFVEPLTPDSFVEADSDRDQYNQDLFSAPKRRCFAMV